LSSLASYGPGNPDTLELIHHSQTPNPVSGYGKSKRMVEEYFETLKDFPYIIFRPTTIYGPREKELFTVFKMVNSGFEFYIGSTPQHLSFIHINDFKVLAFDALESNIKQRSYFVCDGQRYLSSEFNNYIKKALNKKTIKLSMPIPIVKGMAYTLEKTFGLFGKMPALNSERVREFQCTNWTIYTEDLFKDFNFHPQFLLERGVKETADWYKKEGWL
jgi:nucleoside-diphosphate-sugar epimerase